jgi:coenzyme Q-binding protein COQ10
MTNVAPGPVWRGKVNLIIGFKMIRERFTSRVTLSPPDRIDVSYTEGPFSYLNNHWIFNSTEDGGCLIDFYVDFEFRSKMLPSSTPSSATPSINLMQ